MAKNQNPGNEMLYSTVNRLESLVTYQNGSVVSRTLIDKKAGTVTLFAFAAGQGLSEHSAPYDALVQILDGTADITIGGQPLQIKAGETTIMPANIPHALKANQAFKMLLVMIKE
jgi:quercetin dioxygenase-like cupin family protein